VKPTKYYLEELISKLATRHVYLNSGRVSRYDIIRYQVVVDNVLRGEISLFSAPTIPLLNCTRSLSPG
jgi:hypothetical protein